MCIRLFIHPSNHPSIHPSTHPPVIVALPVVSLRGGGGGGRTTPDMRADREGAGRTGLAMAQEEDKEEQHEEVEEEEERPPAREDREEAREEQSSMRSAQGCDSPIPASLRFMRRRWC